MQFEIVVFRKLETNCLERRNEGNVLFNDALSTFYLNMFRLKLCTVRTLCCIGYKASFLYVATGHMRNEVKG